MQIRGIKRGNTIELLQDVDLSDGVEIVFEVKTKMMPSFSERLQRLQAIFGSWQNQPDLDELFTEIEEKRHQYRGREIMDLD